MTDSSDRALSSDAVREPYTPSPDEARNWYENARQVYGDPDRQPEDMADEFDRMIEAEHQKVRDEERESVPFIAVGTDGGTTFALTGHNAGHWVEGSPTHISVEDHDRMIEAVRAEERARTLHDAFWAVHEGRFWGRNSAQAADTFYAGTNAAKRAIADLHGSPITHPWAQGKGASRG